MSGEGRAGRARSCRPAPLKWKLGYEPVVVRMGANPKPNNSVSNIYTKRPIVESDTGGSKPTNFLEMQRRMLWVCLQKFEGFIRLFADRSGKGVVAGPKFWRSMMRQSFFDLPIMWA